jgi:hypothetical protein
MLSTTEIALFRLAQPQWFDTWMEGVGPCDESSVPDELYFDYEAASKHPIFRQEYLPDCLAISEVGDSAILLLNPRVVTDTANGRPGSALLGRQAYIDTGRFKNWSKRQ